MLTTGDERANYGAAPTTPLPLYKCHKEVRALKIKAILQAPADQERVHATGDWLLQFEDERFLPIVVGHSEYVQKHQPLPGGYYVVYDDGYASFSPAAAFEAGYSMPDTSFCRSLEQAINRHSKENGSNTPDFILAQYLADCLGAFDRATKARTDWHSPKPANLDLSSDEPLRQACEPKGNGELCDGCQ